MEPSLSVVFTGTSPVLLPVHVATRLPLPAFMVLKEMEMDWPVSIVCVGACEMVTALGIGGCRLRV